MARLNVQKDGNAGRLPDIKDTVINQLELERGDQTLGNRIVKEVAFARNAGDRPKCQWAMPDGIDDLYRLLYGLRA